MKLNVELKVPEQCAEFLKFGMCVRCGLATFLENAGHEDVSKSARFAILNGHGEMAERLKAAVC